MKRLVLENNQGQVLRSFAWDGATARVIHRKDTRRFEVRSDLQRLIDFDIEFDDLGEIQATQLEQTPFVVPGTGHLRLVTQIEKTAQNVEDLRDISTRTWYKTLLFVFIFSGVFLSFVLPQHEPTARMEAELKQQVVKIVKRIPPKPVATTFSNQANSRVETPKAVKPKTEAIKRLGALAVLGSLNKSSQKGGLNLGAVKTSAGPGLGGTQGSGGVQTSLYGKGLVAAPLGAGGNMQGGGGYGTKGKGGGQAGAGQLSLIGSAGVQPIPMGREAIIGGGLDKDLIAGVIQRNLGQIRFCYEQGLQGNPALAGRVAVNFTINGNGQVSTAGIENTTMNSKLVEDCILLRLRSWKFPLPEGGSDVKVSYPFVLRRTGQG